MRSVAKSFLSFRGVPVPPRVFFLFLWGVGGWVGLNSQRAPEFLTSNFTPTPPSRVGEQEAQIF